MSVPSCLAPFAVLDVVGGRQPLAAQADLSSSRHDMSSAVVARPSGPAMGANRLGIGWLSVADTVRRPRAIEYRDMYHTRLTIHRGASFAELPVFAAKLGVMALRRATAWASAALWTAAVISGVMLTNVA